MRYVQILINLPTVRMDKYLTFRVPEYIQDEDLFGKRVLVNLGTQIVEGFIVADNAPSVPQAMKPVLQVLDQEAVISPAMLDLAHWMAENYLCPVSLALGAILPGPLHKRRGRIVIPLLEPGDRVGVQDISPAGRNLLGRLWESAQMDYQQALRLLSEQELQQLAEKGVVMFSANYHKAVKTSPRYYTLGDYDSERDSARLEKRAPRQAQAIQICKQKGLIEAKVLEKVIPKASLKALLAKGFLRLTEPEPAPLQENKPPTPEQKEVLAALKPAIKSYSPGTWLLHGVTASGKTEVYLQAIQKVIKTGRQAIMLVPEIALTRHLEQVYRARISRLAVLHSLMPAKERYEAWQQIRQGEIDVVLGTRSAIFAPLKRLGLVILDEEHESTYKQEETPRYHAREVALARARMENAVVILGSATPSLESYHRAVKGEFRLLTMKERIYSSHLPRVKIVDMRRHYRSNRQKAISPELATEMEIRLKQGEQVILFLNRRGHSPLIVCRYCGQNMMCPHCAVSLTYHRDRASYLCHYCGYSRAVMQRCPSCGKEGLAPLGYGTQKVEEEVRALFPRARIGRLDMDSSRKRGLQKDIFDKMKMREMDILIGTQMVAKGLDYPGVSLVGIIDADITLNLPDFRAAERTLQLMVQAAGRAGRGEGPGEVLIQTYNPAAKVIQMAAKQNYEQFYFSEIESRELLEYPPFTHILRIIIGEGREKRAEEIAEDIFASIYEIIDAKEDQITVLGPAPCPIARLKGRYRQQIIVKAKNRVLLGSIGGSLQRLKHLQSYRIDMDIDPMSTM